MVVATIVGATVLIEGATVTVSLSLWASGTIGNRKDKDQSDFEKDLSPPIPRMENNTMYLTRYLSEKNETGTLEALQNPSSPQFQAVQWLQEDPVLQIYPEYRLRQRFALAVLYYASNGYTWTSSRDWLSLEHHDCEWSMTRTRDMFAV